MTVQLLCGDCIEHLAALPENSVDSIFTDPPYHFNSIVKRFGKEGSAPAQFGTDGAYARASRGFMGKEWDGGDIAFRPETWAAALRVLKPGGHLLAFGSSKGFHRMAVAIEDGGFEIRDTIMWIYGSGFPKSLDVSKQMANPYDAEEWQGWGTALKPAFEPVIMARKPLAGTVAANVLEWGTGAINIDGCRVPAEGRPLRVGDYKATAGNVYEGRQDGSLMGGSKAAGSTDLGRFPANVIHDGSDEVLAAFPHVKSGKPGIMRKGRNDGAALGAESRAPGTPMTGFGDAGSAARFFYCAKASKADRAGSKHPTVKPVALVKYLVRMVTPPGGTVLDMFAGSGTTGQAAVEEGFNAILIEREPEYQADIRRCLKMDPPAPSFAEFMAARPAPSFAEFMAGGGNAD